MTRREKYPDTETFTYYNANPKNRITGDCEIRAICTALNQSYETTVMELAKLMCETGYEMTDNTLEERYLKSKGWVKCKQPRKFDNTKYTGEEFCKQLAKPDESYIAHIGGHHIVCIKNCKVYDIWNSTGGCIGNYYVKIK